ncbi:MAG TPA: glycosyltransferase [Lacibacter sp.]|nr:glycosyltransferase [Lacibacter sp.]HMO88667.1 glycosyltransferase [Lacibacter sp.]
MKVWMVCNHFLPDQTAGTEVYSWALALHLKHSHIETEIVIPNYGKNVTDHYFYDQLKIHRFAEPSVVDRSLIMGRRLPEGLAAFRELITQYRPDIVHFHELAGSNGISLHHVAAAKEMGCRVVMTFHLAGYTCRTGTLMYKGETICDGRINIKRCGNCYLHSKGFGTVAPVLIPFSILLHKLGIDTMNWNNPLGTALGTANLISNQTIQLQKLCNLCDRLVVLTNWYRDVLHRNGIDKEMITWIPQALAFPDTTNETGKVDDGNGPVRLMFIGRISPFKGLHLLLEALQGLDENAIQLDIYGQINDDDYADMCRRLSAGKSNIHWMGLLPQPKVVSAMRQYSALCLCSTFSEMSPLVIQEAFEARLPVIASNVHGNAEQIKHGKNGLLFKFGDVESLREQLRSCVQDAGILRQIKNNIETPGSFSVVADAYIHLYNQILSVA